MSHDLRTRVKGTSSYAFLSSCNKKCNNILKCTDLGDWKIENFFKIRWQASEKCVEAPVVTEMSYDNGPHSWRRPNLKPRSVVFLKSNQEDQ